MEGVLVLEQIQVAIGHRKGSSSLRVRAGIEAPFGQPDWFLGKTAHVRG